MAGKKKKVKATELKNVRISYVSYVKNPATDILFDVIKSKGSEIIEDECYTDLINSVGSDGEEKSEKKTFKEMLLSLNPFKKTDDDSNEEDKIFIKEVGGMNIAKKIQETLTSINKRLNTLENNKENVSDSLIELKKELEGKEGQEKEKIQAMITLKETLGQVQDTITNYEKQIKEIDEKIEDANDDDVDELESTKVDKETLVAILRGKEADMQKEVKEFEDANPGNDKTGKNKPENGTDNETDNKQTKELTDALNKVSDRLDTLENKRDKSNKMTLEFDKNDVENGEMDPEKDAFWKGAF